MRAAACIAAVVFPALYALGCSTTQSEDEVETTSSTLTSQATLKSTAYLDQRAAAWVAKDDWSFVQGGRCVMSCHTTVPFMMVRPRLPGATGPSGATLSTVRGYVEARVNSWATAAPLYDWVAEDSRSSEAVMNAFALVAADAPSGTLSLTARTALAAMWKEQKADGSFRWWDSFSLAPWENAEAGLWGTALADLAVGLAPASYVSGMSTVEKAKLVRLESFLSARASDSTQPAPLHNRAMILLVASRRPTLLSATVKTEIADAVRALQATDGSWTAASLGFPVSGGVAAGSRPHAYATAFYTYALAQSGDTVAVAKGRTWLEAHRGADGAWEAKSLNAPTEAFNNKQITDGATAYAMMALMP